MSRRRTLGRAVGALALVLVGALPTAKGAPPELEPEGECSAERYLVLTTAPELPALLAREVRTDLAAELRTRGIGVCDAERNDRAAVAKVALRATEDGVSIELDDRVTHKRVARDVAFEPIPEGGRGLATAIAVDELLRASWAELTMSPEPAPPAPEPEPPAPAPTLPPEPHIEHARRVRKLGFAATGGFTQARDSWNAFSLGLRASLWPWRWVWLEGGASLLQTLSVSDPLGRISARGLGAALTAGGCARESRRWFGCGGLRGGFQRLWFSADAADGRASAKQSRGTAVLLEGVGVLGLRLPHRLFALAELSLGAPIKGVVATAGDDAVLGLRGMVWSTALGLGVER